MRTEAEVDERLAGRELTEAVVRRLATHTWVAATTPRGSANAGVVVGSERVLVVDTRVTPAMGLEWARAVIEATGARMDEVVVVNTHFHGDHVFGNGAFRGATFVASALTQEAQRREWDDQIAIFRELRPAQAHDIATARQVVAGIGFSRTARIDLGGIDVELELAGPAHTPGDVIVRVPADDLVFAADLVFNGHWPSTWNADFAGWLRALRELEATAPPLVVPGHGPAGDRAMVAEMAEVLRFLIGLEVDDGGDPDAAIVASPYAEYLHPQRIAEARERIRAQMTDDLIELTKGAAA